MKARQWVPVATAMALALGVSESAVAGAYALAYDNIFDLVISSNPTIPVANFTSFSTQSGADATLNGGPIAGGSDAQGGPANAPVANAGGGTVTRIDNAMNFFGAGGTYSNADAQVSRTVLQQAPGGPVTTTGSTSTQAWNIAESSVANGGTATANGNNSSTTGFSFTVAVTANTVFSFDFSALPYMESALGADSAAGSHALSKLDVIFSITNDITGTNVFEWKPDGTVNANIVGGVETADGANLNRNLNVTTAGQDLVYNPCGLTAADIGQTDPTNFCSFLAATNSLAAGTYTLTLTMVEHTDLLNATVPEPASLALVGLGLMGMGAVRRRQMRS